MLLSLQSVETNCYIANQLKNRLLSSPETCLKPHDFGLDTRPFLSRLAIDGESVLDRVLRELVESERCIHGRDGQTSMLIVDSRSVKNADTAEQKGYDAGKKHQV